MRALLVGGLLLVVACSPMVFAYEKPLPASERDRLFARDKYACDRETTQYLRNRGLSDLQYRKHFGECMAVRGWKRQ